MKDSTLDLLEVGKFHFRGSLGSASALLRRRVTVRGSYNAAMNMDFGISPTGIYRKTSVVCSVLCMSENYSTQDVMLQTIAFQNIYGSRKRCGVRLGRAGNKILALTSCLGTSYELGRV